MFKFNYGFSLTIFLAIIHLSNAAKTLKRLNLNNDDGKMVDIEDPRFGHTISILYKDQTYTGVVHNAFNVLTVGHPFIGIDISKLKVRIGSTYSNKGGQVISVKEVQLHPKYNKDKFTYDIAFLRLGEKIDLIQYPVRNILYYNQDITKPESGENVFTTGWGQSQEDGILRTTDIEIIENKVCQRKYKYTGDTICAGYEPGQRATNVDSVGGPLVCQHNDHNYLCGIKVHEKRHGILKGYPGIYVRVNHPHIYEWIRKGGFIDPATISNFFFNY